MRSNLRFFIAAASLFAIGCSESPTGTSAAKRSLPSAPPAFDYASSGWSFGTGGSDFTLTSQGGTFSVNGLFSVNFPANAVCDPSRSSYGPGTWDSDCATLAPGQSIKVHASVSLGGRGLGVDFTPALRFAPSAQVTISTDVFASMIRANRYYLSNHPSSLNSLAIFYAASPFSAPEPDFVTDSSVITHVDLSTGRIWRRVKHFSGYNQTAGTACNPGPNNPDCVQVDQSTTP